jgi:hypothetical protein
MAGVVTEGEATYAALKAIRPHQAGLLRTITAVDSYVGTTKCTNTDAYPVLDGVGTVHARLGYTFSGSLEEGEPSGYGVLQWRDGRSVVGTFTHGCVDGVGTLRWPNGDTYSGELHRNVRHGSGSFVSENGAARYEGGWRDGMRHGEGVQQYANGSVYKGQWAYNARHGRGTLRYHTGDVYEGEWVADVPSGYGSMGWVDSSKRLYKELYVGEWRGGKPEGSGQSTYVSLPKQSTAPADTPTPPPVPSIFMVPAEARLNVYVGEYRNGQREGAGTFYYADGSCCHGLWKGGVKCGSGVFISAVGELREEQSTTGADEGGQASALAAVPTVSPHGLGNLLESEEDLRLTLHNLLQRYNTTLKSLFQHCCRLKDAVALPSTPRNWWQQRLPGRATLTQCLALLHAAHIIGAAFTIGDALRTAAVVVSIEATNQATRSLSPSSQTLKSLSSAVDDINQADGALSYRQFCEWLIRVAAQVERGPTTITITDKLRALLEGPLGTGVATATSAVAAVFLPHSLQHTTDVQALLPALQRCYKELQTVCSGDKSSEESHCGHDGLRCGSGVSLRSSLTAMQSTLARHRIAPASVVAALAWLKDAEVPTLRDGVSTAPSLLLTQELRMSAVAKNKAVQQPDEDTEATQSFVEFVETLMTIADLVHDSDGAGTKVFLEEVQGGLFAM